MPSNGRSIKFYKYYKQWVETYKVGQVRGVTLNKYYLVAKDRKYTRKIEIQPDLVADFTKLPFRDMEFHLITRGAS